MGTTLQEHRDWLDEARDADLGFRGRVLAHCSQPRVDQGKRSHFVRQNGPFNLVMSAGVQEMLAYENLPRLLPARDCTEVVRIGQRNLVPGKSLSGFMDRFGSHSTSGCGRRRMREQMERLLGCAISLHFRGDDKSVRLARAALLYRARAAHPPLHARADFRRSIAGRLRLASCVSTPLLRFSQGDRRPSSLPKSLSRTVLRSGLRLPPGARLPFEPLGRRKPPARTLHARPTGRLSLPCPCRHCAALHSASLRPPAVGFGRCRRSRVSGKRSQTLYA